MVEANYVLMELLMESVIVIKYDQVIRLLSSLLAEFKKYSITISKKKANDFLRKYKTLGDFY